MIQIARDVLEKASTGDRAAFEEVYTASSGFVYSVALRITANTEDAQEVVQDVFLKVYRYLKGFQFRSSFTTWLYRITTNTSLNITKKHSKERVKRDNLKTLAKEEGSASVVEAGSEKESCEVKLKELLAHLNPEQRTCILLREIEGLDYKEIAKVLKTNINTVRSRLKRAREILMRKGGEVS